MVQHPRGKLLGGCSAINVQILAYPSRAELDALIELGISGWDWETIAPYYRKFHTPCASHEGGQDIQQNLETGLAQSSGPIKTSLPIAVDPLHRAWIDSLQNLQHGLSGHPLSGESIGAYALPCAVDPDTRERSFSGKAYVDLACGRPNFHLLTATKAEHILFDESSQRSNLSNLNGIISHSTGEEKATATGVIVAHKGQSRVIKARKEVILCTGAFGSPQLLELSGVGSPELLKKHGINLVVNNPNVGENLQDHMSVGMSYEVNPNVKTLDSLFHDPASMDAAITTYKTTKTGPLSHSPVQAIAFLPSSVVSGLPPDAPSLHSLLESHLDPTTASKTPTSLPSTPTQHRIITRHLLSPKSASATLSPISLSVYPTPKTTPTTEFFTQLLMLSHPLSRGTVHIASPSPHQPPIIDPAYLSHPLDLHLYALHLMYLERIATTPPLSSLLKSPPDNIRLPTGHDALTYEHAIKTIKEYAGTFYHPCGSCAMMSREMGGVVDERLRVYGTRNLRVCDASVIPMVLRGNIVTSVFAWAERASDIVKEDWRQGRCPPSA